MNIALALALIALTLNLATALSYFAVSRARGWTGARRFAWIALSAALYSAANLVPPIDGLPLWLYHWAARWNYFWAYFHMLAWYPFVFSGEGPHAREVGPRLRVFLLASFGFALFCFFTGLHLAPGLRVVEVPWAHLHYNYTRSTPFGDAYTVIIMLTLLVPFGEIVRRARAGDRDMVPILWGFPVFFGAALVEALVANSWLVAPSPADLGFIAVVLPASVVLLRRFLSDAHRLDELSRSLAGEVRDRTEERDRAEHALVESERLAALGRLAAGVGHEVNNPLTYMTLATERVGEYLARAGAPADVHEAVGHVRDGARRIRKVVEGLRTYSRRQDERGPLALGDVVRAAMEVARPQLRHVASVETAPGDSPRVLGDEPRLVQALVNLLVNAGQAIGTRPGPGRIVVRLATSAAGEAVLEVEDDGPGLDAAARAHLAEPYFTTRAATGGLGLGLFVTRGIVDAHEGRLEFDSEPGRGTRARIVLPALVETASEPAIAASPAVPALAPPVHDGAPPRRARLLLVDDEPLVLELLARVLEREWDVTTAADGGAAMTALECGAYDAIVCDLMMPGISGIDLSRLVRERHPALTSRIVYLTGGAVTSAAQEFLARPGVRHLMKPVDFAELRELLRVVSAAGSAAPAAVQREAPTGKA